MATNSVLDNPFSTGGPIGGAKTTATPINQTIKPLNNDYSLSSLSKQSSSGGLTVGATGGGSTSTTAAAPKPAPTPTPSPAPTGTQSMTASSAPTTSTSNWTVDKTKTPILNGMADDGGQVYEGSNVGGGRIATAIGGAPRYVTIAEYQALLASQPPTGTTQPPPTGTTNPPPTGTTQPPPTGTAIPPPAGGVAGNGQGDPNDPFNGTYGPNGERYWNEDQGTGNYRTDVSPGRTIPENVTRQDGGVQGQFKDARGNYYNAFAETAGAMSPMEVEQMQAAFAAKNGRAMTQEELSAYQLNDILKQDSPLMSLARQDGIEFANRRGGLNSSLAAGASMAEMARQATPLAMQQAEAYRAMQEQNQQLESARLEANAGREQQGNMFNADVENQATSQEFQSEAQRREANAARITDTNVKNAAMSNDMLAKDRSLSMSYALQQLSGDQDLSKQRLASTLAKELAVIEGDYKALLSQNDSASRLLSSYTDAMSQIMADKDIPRDVWEAKLNAMKVQVQEALDIMGAMNNLDLGSLGEAP